MPGSASTRNTTTTTTAVGVVRTAKGTPVPLRSTVSREARIKAASRFAGLGLEPAAESAYQALLEHPAWTVEELGAHLDVTVKAAGLLVARLQELDLVTVIAGKGQLRPVDPELGLSALAARLDAELAERRQQLEQGRMAISELVAGLGRIGHSNSGQLADVCWGAREVAYRVGQLISAASSEVVAMNTATALAVDEAIMFDRCVEGVCYRLVFADTGRPEPARDRWLRDLTEDGVLVRVGQVPTAALIIDATTVALPICDATAGQIVGLATLRLPSAVTAVVELFERVWAEAVPLNGTAADEGNMLPPRERELLALLVAGTTDESAACRLGVSVRTVRRMVSDLMQRLGARSRFEAGARAAERGWLRMAVESN
jgi:DNA-binding CsgD family transcriptional regulator